MTLFAKPKELEAIRIKLASPEDIRKWSSGEVKKAETINYRTQKPERDGLFCEKIFGPVKDYECYCGRYKGKRFQGQICDKCGVEITKSDVRRERMGHIELVVPVAHIWFYKIPPSIIGMLLDKSMRELEAVLYYDAYIITDRGDTDLEVGQVLTQAEYEEYMEKYKGQFVAEMGAPPIQKLLKELDLEGLAAELRTMIEHEKSILRRTKLLKRLRIVDAFINSGNKPEWMILTVLPVIPPDLRPLVPLGGGRFASSDINDLYRRVISRNNRLRNLIEYGAPEIILRNEKRMLQEAVDALLDNARRKRPVTGKNNRRLSSLSDILRGKKGLFRRNLLGKRVDYSGRSVIVVGPELKLYQVGIPKEMAVELFKPMVEHKISELGVAKSGKTARELVREKNPEMWAVLEDVMKDHPVLLNRAPTLHRPSIQAFEPVLVEGKAINLHPLVCAAYNADFDGDAMAVFVPLSPEAILEAKLLLLSPNHIISPAHGNPLATASQDMVVGINFLTKVLPYAKGTGKYFSSPEAAIIAYEHNIVDPRALVKVKLHNGEIVETTVGRIIFNQILPQGIGFLNKEFDKKAIRELAGEIFRKFGTKVTAEFLDSMMRLGFYYATKSGITFGIDDLKVPPEKNQIIENAMQEREKIEKAYRMGILSRIERYQTILDIWTRVTEEVKNKMVEYMKKDMGGFNPIFLMVNSGARGNIDQVRQLAGMRGLMTRPTKSSEMLGEFIETPVISNFKEGLSTLEYFISTHGARKGLSDTALKTADAGYLTRRLVDIAQEVVVTMEDCGTIMGRALGPLKEGETVIEPLSERILGRVALEDVIHPSTGEVILKAGEVIDEEKAKLIEGSGVETVHVRTVMRCNAPHGVCAKCYGWDLSTGRLVEIGEAVGVIAAQSIGEPGTQLTLRTFHTGGAAERIAEEAKHVAPFDGIVEYADIQFVEKKMDYLTKRIVTSKKGKLILRKDGQIREFNVPYGALLKVKDKEQVTRGQVLCEWELYALPILTLSEGIVKFEGIVEGITLRELVEEGKVERVIEIDKHKRYFPQVKIIDKETNQVKEIIYLVQDARLSVTEGQMVTPGDLIAKVPREVGKTRDITGGLPRVEQLFEARTPKDKAILSEISGYIWISDPEKGVFVVTVENPEAGQKKEYKIPYGKYLLVASGDYIEAGEPLTTGPIDPHDVLRIKGKEAVQEFLLDQIQQVYRLSGVEINDKHIEIIVRQMLRKVQIIDPGDTKFVHGDIVDYAKVNKVNRETILRGGKPSSFKNILVGITRASLETDSFIAAASFQETTKILAMAAIEGQKDELVGLKENVILGSIIPAGTGFKKFRSIELLKEFEKIEEEEVTAPTSKEEENLESNP